MTFTRAIGVSISQSTMSGSELQYCSVYRTKSDGTPELVNPTQTGLQDKWTHESLFNLIKNSTIDEPTIVGIDYPLSFPEAFLREFDESCDFDIIAEGIANGKIQEYSENYSIYRLNENDVEIDSIESGVNTWQRRTECRRFPKFVFLPGKPKEVPIDRQGHILAHWTLKRKLRELRSIQNNIHLWPFDGWKVLEGKSCLVEAYPPCRVEPCSLIGHTAYHNQNADRIASWLQQITKDGSISSMLKPNLPDDVRSCAMKEGWILGEEWDTSYLECTNRDLNESDSLKPKENSNCALHKAIQFLCGGRKKG